MAALQNFIKYANSKNPRQPGIANNIRRMASRFIMTPPKGSKLPPMPVPQEDSRDFGQEPLYKPHQEQVLDWLLKSGQQAHQRGQTGLEELMQPMTPYEQSANRIAALANAGATPGSYGGDIGSLAGGALGSIFGPGGTTAGGVAGRLGGSLLGNWFDRYQAQGAFEPYEQQARQDFQRSTMPRIAEQFAGMGGLNSGAFQNALVSSAADLESQLANAKANYNANQLQELMRQKESVNNQVNMQSDRDLQQRELQQRYLQGLQNQGLRQMELGLGPRFQSTYQQEDPGNFERFGAPILYEGAKQGIRALGNYMAPGSGELANATGASEVPLKSLSRVYNYFKKTGKKTRR